MQLSVPCLFLGCLLLTVSCKKAEPEIDSSLLLGVWTQQRHTEMKYETQGPVGTTDVAHSDRCLVFKTDVYRDSTLHPVIVSSYPTNFYFPYTLQGKILSLGYALRKYEVRELTAHSLALHTIIPPEDLPSKSHPLPAGTVSVSFITDEYFTR